MSILYADSNFESTGDLFKKRLMYRIKSKRSVRDTKNIVNFTIGEKMLYGKVDVRFSPIFIKYDSNLITIRNSESAQPLKAVNFVADLFNEMCLEFDKCAAKGQIDTQDPFLSSLKAFKAFQDPTTAYLDYRAILFQQIAANFQKFNIEVENFQHFMEEFMKMANRSATSTPYTMSAFLKSDLNSIFSSGLAIEIADLKYSDDEKKVEQFIKSRNWNFFVNACNKYGFMIDYNIPWRIVCDVKAPEISEVRSRYYTTVDMLFTVGYYRASIESFLGMPAFLLDLYNLVKKKKFKKQVICGKKTIMKTIVPENYTREDLLVKYGLTYFLRTYMKLRLLEEKPDIEPETKRLMIKDVLEYVNLRDDYLAVENYFEQLINKPFDKHYSHTYNNNIVFPAVKPIFEGQPQTMGKNAVQTAMMSY